MKLEIKNIDCMGCDFHSLTNEEYEYFHEVITVSIGFENKVGADDFTVYVYTVKWLDMNLSLPILGKSSIIMKNFNIKDFHNYINSILDQCNHLPFNSEESALKIVAQYFDWEFENYTKNV